MDSTYVHHNGNSPYLLILADSCEVRGFHFGGIVDTSSSGTLTYRLKYGLLGGANEDVVVQQNRFAHLEYGAEILFTDQIVSPKRIKITDNVFSHFYVGVDMYASSSDIRGNVFAVTNQSMGSAVSHVLGRSAVVIDNVITRTVRFTGPLIDIRAVDSVTVNNNVCVSQLFGKAENIAINRLHGGFPSTGVVQNNLSVGSEVGISSSGGDLRITNNMVVGSQLGDLFWDEAATSPGNVGFNLFWANYNYGRPLADSLDRLAHGCLFALPMFVDSLDFHLQAFSPAIDAGDTTLLDGDGSRSDIGPFGGPMGSTYPYIDLAPSAPVELAGTSSDTSVSLSWSGGQEADFDRFEVYRDTVPFDDVQTSGFLAHVGPDTTFLDLGVSSGQSYYYRVRALDGQGNASAPSDLLLVVVSGVDEHPVVPIEFKLHPSRPNPFNSSTLLRFELVSGARPLVSVRLSILDVLGREVIRLVDGLVPPGAHEITWKGIDSHGEAVPSGVYVATLEAEGHSASRKMLLIK
jgi:hypothetical protein